MNCKCKALLDKLPAVILWRQKELSIRFTKDQTGTWWGSYGGFYYPKIFDEIGDENFCVMLEKLCKCLEENNLLTNKE